MISLVLSFQDAMQTGGSALNGSTLLLRLALLRGLSSLMRLARHPLMSGCIPMNAALAWRLVPLRCAPGIIMAACPCSDTADVAWQTSPDVCIRLMWLDATSAYVPLQLQMSVSLSVGDCRHDQSSFRGGCAGK
jgi:hypothetical protein